MMKIGFVVNQTQKEHVEYTTTGLALQASKMGHEIYYIGVGDFAYTKEEAMAAHARTIPPRKFRTSKTLLEAIKKSPKKMITSSELDVIMLRNDPSLDFEKRSWAQHSGIVFGKLAQQREVLVVNDPGTLAEASNKMYFQYFPRSVRPETIITRSIEDIRNFYKEHQKKIILKPLQGSGGRNVFYVSEQQKNFNQIVDAICRDGYIIAQEYLPEAKSGDIRLFLLNGEPIIVNGHIAALHRTQAKGDIRSNVHQGASVKKPEITPRIHQIVEEVRPKLIKDDMFFTGLDIVGSKLMEINVFSPGGLGTASKLFGVNFFEPVIRTLEKKLT